MPESTSLDEMADPELGLLRSAALWMGTGAGIGVCALDRMACCVSVAGADCAKLCVCRCFLK